MIPVFIGKYYQLAFQTHSPRGRLFDHLFVRLHDIHIFFIVFTLLIVAKALFTFLEKYLSGYSAEIFSRDLRDNLVQTQFTFTMSVFEKKPPGKYLLRYSGDLLAIQRYITNGIIKFSIDIIFLVFAFAFLSFINLQLAIIIFCSFPPFFFAIYFLNRYLQRLTIKRRNIRSENLAFVSSRLHSLLTVKVFNRESIEHKKFTRNSEKLFQYGKKYYRLYGVISALFPFFLYALFTVMLIYTNLLNTRTDNTIPPAELLIFIMMLIALLPLMRRVLRVNIIWQAGNVSINKILRIFNNETETKDKNDEVKFETGKIEINNLDFSFLNGRQLFSNFSAVINPQSITLIKGPQGVGKSTLFKILLGIYKPQGGKITVDGVDLLSLSKHSIRKNITMVSDELPLIGRTIFEVVSYSRKEEKRDRALEMLQKLSLRLTPGLSPSERGEDVDLDYPITDGGKNLSAGEKKILMIARALLTNKKILLLDEPFKDLDAIARDKLTEVLIRLKEKRTIVVINQNETSFAWYDQVIGMTTEVSSSKHPVISQTAE